MSSKIHPSIWIVLALIVLVCPLLQYNSYLSHDVSWHLLETQRFLAGGTYQQNFMDVSPPSIIFTLVPPVLMAKYFAIDLLLATRIYMFLVCSASLIICGILLKKLFSHNRLFLNALVIVSAFILFILPVYEFAQQDHLVIALTLPYFYLIAALTHSITVSRKLRLIIGLLAGIGFVLNIQFWPLFLLCELYLMMCNRTYQSLLRLDVIIIVLLGLGYIASIEIFTPDYFHFVLPLVMFLYAGAYNLPWSEILGSTPSISFLAVLLGYLIIFRIARERRLLTLLMIVNTFFWMSYIFTRKIWYYHQYAVLALSIILLLMMIIETLSHLNQQKTLLVTGALTGYFLLILLTGPLYVYLKTQTQTYKFYNPNRPSLLSKIIATTKRLADQQPVFAFSDRMWQGSLITYANVNYASRFNTLWMLPGLVERSKQDLNSHNYKQYKRAVMLEESMLSLDFYHYRPKIIIIDNAKELSYLGKDSPNYIQFFNKSACFRDIWQHYFLKTTVDHYQFYASTPAFANPALRIASCDALNKNRRWES